MINETRFKGELKSAVKNIRKTSLRGFMCDYRKTIDFYDICRTGNERTERDEDTQKLTKMVQMILYHVRGSRYIDELRKTNINAWLIAKYLKEENTVVTEIVKERGVI